MSKILYAWELGGGIGHVAPFYLIARQLAEEGHRLHFAVRELPAVVRLYRGLDCALYQAPTNFLHGRAPFPHPLTLPQILHNVGLSNPSHLMARVVSWKSLLDLVQPDLIIADHAPGVLIASRGREIPTVLIGTGFVCPLLEYPMRNLCSWLSVDLERCRQSEDALVEQINIVLQQWGQPTLASLSELYGQAQTQFLTTFRELDHYGPRPDADYLGVWPYSEPSVTDVCWPQGDGKKVFAYLKPSRGLGALFDWLAARGNPTIVVGDGLDFDALRRVAKPNICFCSEPLALREVGRQCDLAILNATHGTTCSLLLEGKPLFQLPHNLEQTVTAVHTMELGVASQADKDDGSKIVWEFSGFLHHDRFAEHARNFAERYGAFRPEDGIARVMTQLGRLLQ